MRLISISLILLLAFSASAEVWMQTDWSDPDSFSFQESIDFYSCSGEIRLSNWILDLYQPWNTIPEVRCLFASSEDWVYAGTTSPDLFNYGHGIFIHSNTDTTSWHWIRYPFDNSIGIYSITEWSGDLYAGCMVYGQVTEGAIFKSTDGGWNWFEIGERFISNFSPRIFASSRALWMVGTGVFRKSGDGESWDSIDFPGTISYLREAPLLEYPPGLWVAASDGIYLTSDDGVKWERVFDQGISCPCPPVEIEGKIYILSDAGIYRIVDEEKWEFFTSLPPGFEGWLEAVGENLYLVDGHYKFSPGSGKVYQFADSSWQLVGWLNSLFQELECSAGDSLGDLYVSGIAERHPDRVDPPYPTFHIAKMVKNSEEVEKGFLISNRYHNPDVSSWGVIQWQGEGVKVQVRTGNDDVSMMFWHECDVAKNGSDISALNSVSDGDTIIQWRVTLEQDGSCENPFMEEIFIEYNSTDILEEEAKVTLRTQLFQSQPNPFTWSTVINYHLGLASNASLKIYNATGRLIRALQEGPQDVGSYQVFWDGRNGEGMRVPAGVYFYRLETQNLTTTRKLVMVR